MESSNLIWIPLLPFLGFLLNGLFGKRLGPKFVSIVAVAAPASAFLIAFDVFQKIRESGGHLQQHAFDWIKVGTFDAPFGLHADGLTSVMLLVITGVGSLIHLYSVEYMRGDKGFYRYFAYLNLFTAFMLVLVLGDNLLLLFVGWEGVGLCSYLLIGFWFEETANARAGKKAFIVNRIGDFGVLLAIFLCHQVFGTINTSEIVERIGRGGDTLLWGWSANEWIALLLFIGATGKSAQIPLYVWLPDAMAGPTPVSALIHAATMVTSGVYLCCRLNPLFAEAADVSMIIAGVGASTALLAALIALTQNDIKKVLAYSTVSQLGFMFFAIGVGAYKAAFFHVVTHAFFKALLFLGSGSVIHSMHHEQDMRKMGGLKDKLPKTYWTYLIGTLAIAGVPFFSGFFSKDEILFYGFKKAFYKGTEFFPALFWAMCLFAAVLTAFYMLRSVALTFWGESRVDKELLPSVHEHSGWITWVLLLLAIPATIGGFIGVPGFLPLLPDIFGENVIAKFTGLGPDSSKYTAEELSKIHSLEWVSLFFSVAAGAIGLGLALFLYGSGREKLDKWVVSPLGSRLRRWSENKFYVDEFYDLVFVKTFHFVSAVLHGLVDRILIDILLVEGTAKLTRGTGQLFRRTQSGLIPAYLLTFGFGALVLIFFALLWKGGQ